MLIEALLSLIVVRNQPFTLVEWPEFHALCRALNPAYEGKITTAHSQVQAHLRIVWPKHKDIVRRELQAALSRIHISCDIWTSPNQLLLLAIVAHFITHDSQKRKALIALPQVFGHSGEEQLGKLLPVLEDYGIVRRLGAIITDNAPPNNVLCRLIQAHFSTELGLDWAANDWRIRCIGHIINLVVQAFLFTNVFTEEELESYDSQEQREGVDEEAKRAKFRLLGPLGKAHNIVVFIRGSPLRITEFKASAGRLIPMDNSTRWNSWFYMLVVLLDVRPAVDTFTLNHKEELAKDALDFQDWVKLRTIKEFLGPFHRATLAIKGDSSSIDTTLFTMDILVKHVTTEIVSSPLPSSLL